MPANGYYEWQKLEGGKKQPCYLHADDGAPLAFAGLYEWWKDPQLPEGHPEKWRWTNTVLTTTASDALGHVHDRSPVIVLTEMLDDWLNPSITDLADVREMSPRCPSRTWCRARSVRRSGACGTTVRSSSSRSTSRRPRGGLAWLKVERCPTATRSGVRRLSGARAAPHAGMTRG